MRLFILGAGKSGLSAAGLGKRLGAEVFLFDDKDGDRAEAIIRLEKADTVIVSPGVSPQNPIYIHAKKCGKRIQSEIEFAFLHCKAPVVALTGTNGKTTTTMLTRHLLSAGGLSAREGGNIGTPFSDFAQQMTPDEVAVLECSSFMTESMTVFRPRIAALLNLSPDHLDRHGNMEAYTEAKMKLFQNQRAEDFAVFNLDLVVDTKRVQAQKYFFSTEQSCLGAYLCKGMIMFDGQAVCPQSATTLLGRHNAENVLAAVTIAKILGIENADIERGLATFSAVPHRLEPVGEFGGIRFINDSKATNIESAVKAAWAVQGFTVMILGGSDKGYEYDGLFDALPPHIKHCVFLGAVTEKLVRAAARTGFSAYTKCQSLSEAVQCAVQHCKAGGTVLLSPASASFDMFENFEDRGRAFQKIVREYGAKNQN